jgi:hypothetical protein
VVAVLSSPGILQSIAKEMVEKTSKFWGIRNSMVSSIFDIEASATSTTALRSWITHDLELAPDQLAAP